MIFIPYVIGAFIGIIATELYHEEKAKEAIKPPDQTTPVENPPTSEPQTLENNDGDNNDGDGEEKEVKFVAKSRGKKK